MGGALGWFVVALAGLVGAPPAEQAKAQITYTVRMVEVEGVDWREGVFDRLKPVTRQGAATVWTVPRDATEEMVTGFLKSPEATMLEAPKVTATSGTAAVIQCRRNRPVVMQAAWNGHDSADEPKPENVRVGWHTTIVGRKLDQGILVQLVFEDTVIKAVHHVTVNRPAEPACAGAGETSGQNAGRNGVEKASGLMAIAHAIMCSEEACSQSQASCPADRCTAKDDGVQRVVLDVPEIDTHEVLGEWLIPHGQVLLVSFGAYTVADQDGMAVVKERLAMIEADEANTPVAMMKMKGLKPIPARELVPRRLEPIAPPPMLASPGHGNVSIVPLLPPPASVLTAPVPPARMVAPPTPSRSFPQGVHADGTPADLPPLPADETESDSSSSSSESSEPMPSPQTKKIPPPKPIAKPASDSGTNKAEFTLPKAAALFVPSLFLPSQTTSFQFLMPIKPLSLKLPFGQKLEIEVIGRVVPETSEK